MKFLWYNIPCIICLVAGFYLAEHNIEGWGWFLFVGLLACIVPRRSKDKDDDVDDE